MTLARERTSARLPVGQDDTTLPLNIHRALGLGGLGFRFVLLLLGLALLQVSLGLPFLSAGIGLLAGSLLCRLSAVPFSLGGLVGVAVVIVAARSAVRVVLAGFLLTSSLLGALTCLAGLLFTLRLFPLDAKTFVDMLLPGGPDDSLLAELAVDQIGNIVKRPAGVECDLCGGV